MIHKTKIRLNHFWQTKIRKKRPTHAEIFIKERYNGLTQKHIIYKDWAEVATLWNKLLSWEAFVLANGPKVAYSQYQDIQAGWKKINYE